MRFIQICGGLCGFESSRHSHANAHTNSMTLHKCLSLITNTVYTHTHTQSRLQSHLQSHQISRTQRVLCGQQRGCWLTERESATHAVYMWERFQTFPLTLYWSQTTQGRFVSRVWVCFTLSHINLQYLYIVYDFQWWPLLAAVTQRVERDSNPLR